MIRYVCKSRACEGFVGCFFGEDKRVHEGFFEEKIKRDAQREQEECHVYGCDWVAQISPRVRVVIHESVTRDGLTVVD